jgi:hypothetical protein
MKRTWLVGILNTVMLGIIISCIGLTTYVVDPYQFNRTVDLGLEKRAVTERLNYYNWKFAEFGHDPTPVVLLGDSRMDSLPAEEFAMRLGTPAYNFSFGGGSAFDAVEAFWFAAAHNDLEAAFIGLNALLLNDHNRVRRSREAVALTENPLGYYLSPTIVEATAKVLVFNASGVNLVSEKPPMDRDTFWAHQLAQTPRQFFSDYAYPSDLLEELKKIGEYCESEEIELTFLILPTHVDLQATRQEYGVEEDYRRSIAELRTISRVLDWDFPNELTRDAGNFHDPFHMTEAVARRVAAEAASGEPTLARVR